MKFNQQQKIVLWLLGIGVFFSLGSYFILYPTIHNIFEKRELQKKQLRQPISFTSWDSIRGSWERLENSFNHSLFSPDSLVTLALESSLGLKQLKVLASGNEYRFHIEGNFDSIYSFIQAIGIKAPYWAFEQFELVKSSKPNLYYLKNVCLNHVHINSNELKDHIIQELEVKMKIKKMISFRERKKYLNFNPFENERVVPIKVTRKSQSCRLPLFQIKGVIARRVLHVEQEGSKIIYRMGDFIGDYRIQNIETKRILLICGQDTISRYL